MHSYDSFRSLRPSFFPPGMPSTGYKGLSAGGAGYSPGVDKPIPTVADAGQVPDQHYPVTPQCDTYDPIWAEYESDLPDYKQSGPWDELVTRSASPLRPLPQAHFDPPQPPEYGSPADRLLTEWCINRAFEELLDPAEPEPVPLTIDAVTQPAHMGGDLYGYGSAELLQPAGDASAVLGDTLDRHVEETLDIGRPCPGESFEATHPYADDPLFRDPLEDIVEQEMQQFGDPYGLTGPSGTPEPIAPGFGFDGEEMGPLW